MLATVARSVPDNAFAALLSLPAAKVTLSPSSFTSTEGSIDCVSVPSGPFTTTSPGLTVTWTLSGTVTGYFAIRDMARSPLDDDAEHFAAQAGLARAPIGHHALGRGDDRHAEPVHDARDIVAALVDAQARARDALELLDHGLAGVVLEADFDPRLAVEVAHREVLDVALVLQDLGDGLLHLRCRHQNADLFRGLGVADARQHVGDGITHAHLRRSYQLALIIPGISPRIAISRILLRASPNLRNVPRGRPVNAQRLRRRTGEASRGSACSFARAWSRASSVAFESWMIASSALRFSAYFFTVARRFASRLMTASLAITSPSQF